MQLGELNPLAAKTDEARLYSVAHLIVNGPIGDVGQLKCCIEQTIQMSYDVEFHASAYAGSITKGVKGNLRILPPVSRDQQTVFGAAVPGQTLEQGEEFDVF